jgi:hypothetical protein
MKPSVTASNPFSIMSFLSAILFNLCLLFQNAVFGYPDRFFKKSIKYH